MPITLLLLLATSANAQFIYDWQIASSSVNTANVSGFYNQHATNSTFVVEVPLSEQDTTCRPREERGSAHHPSCNITSVVTGSAELVQVLTTTTIAGNPGLTEPVCVDNGGYACAAAYMDTESRDLQEGDVVTASWAASSGDYYELLVVLIDTGTAESVWSYGRRGVSSASNQSYGVSTTGNYILRFYAGVYLYDATVNNNNNNKQLQSDITLTSVRISTDTSLSPTSSPTGMPAGSPSASPTDQPSLAPTDAPSSVPSNSQTNTPTEQPTSVPSLTPTAEEAPFATSTTAIIIYAVSGVVVLSIFGCVIYTLSRIQRGAKVRQPVDMATVAAKLVDNL